MGDDRMHSLLDHPTDHLGGLGTYYRTEGVNDDSGIFFMVRIKGVVGDDAIALRADGTERVRCDAGSYGPYAFHEWDAEAGACVCGSTDPVDSSTGTHLIAFADLKFVNTILDVYPHGMIGYLESSPESEAAQMASWPHCSGRTLQELFRLIIEWSDAYEYFGNRQPPAVVAHGVLEQLAMPDDIKAWLIDSVPAQKIEKFLRGDAHARERSPGVPDMSVEFDDWIARLLETSTGLGERRVAE